MKQEDPSGYQSGRLVIRHGEVYEFSYNCLKCGAVVEKANTLLHTAFHDSLDTELGYNENTR